MLALHIVRLLVDCALSCYFLRSIRVHTDVRRAVILQILLFHYSSGSLSHYDYAWEYLGFYVEFHRGQPMLILDTSPSSTMVGHPPLSPHHLCVHMQARCTAIHHRHHGHHIMQQLRSELALHAYAYMAQYMCSMASPPPPLVYRIGHLLPVDQNQIKKPEKIPPKTIKIKSQKNPTKKGLWFQAL